jgi:hypothetical protein
VLGYFFFCLKGIFDYCNFCEIDLPPSQEEQVTIEENSYEEKNCR